MSATPGLAGAPTEDAVAKPAEADPTEEVDSERAAEAAKKASAIEDFKAAMQRAAAGIPKAAAAAPAKAKQPEVEALLTFCLCVQRLAHESKQQQDASADSGALAPTPLETFVKELPRLAEARLGPLLGISKMTADATAAPAQTSSRMVGRVKSYNTKKGFGFLDVPGYPRDIFVFNAHLIGRIGLLAGEYIEFTLVFDEGRPQARQVRCVTNPNVKPTPISADNPINSLKAAMSMAQPPTGPTMRDLTLAMAAAAAEVPTALPSGQQPSALAGGGPPRPMASSKSPDEQLYEQIREAQSASATDKRQQAPRSQEDTLDAVRNAQAKRAAQVAKESQQWHAAQVAGRVGDPPLHPEAAEGKYNDEGNIPRGTKVRVVNFAVTEVNDCVGVVQGFDAATGRYAVSVEMHKGNLPAESVPFQLREEYLRLEDPMGNTRGSAQGPPPPLPGASTSTALQKSANEALRRFSNLNTQQQPPPQPQPGLPQMMGGPQLPPNGYGPPGKGGYGKGMPFANHGGMPGGPPPDAFGGRGPPPQQQMPPGPMRPGMAGPHQQGGPPYHQFGPPGPQQQPQPKAPGPIHPGGPPDMAAGGKGVASRQRVSLEDSLGNQPQAQRQAQPTGTPLEHFARPMGAGPVRPGTAAATGPPPPGSSAPATGTPGPGPPGGTGPGRMPPMPQAGFLGQSGVGPKAAVASAQMAQQQKIVQAPTEGAPGKQWRVLQSKDFCDVIVRETKEVNSRELRRIMPNEVCIQQGPTVALQSGLVRMPVVPDGWVTVHARLIGGPTFLEEVDKQPPQQQVPKRGGQPQPASSGSLAPGGPPMPPQPPQPSQSFQSQQRQSPPRERPRPQQPPQPLMPQQGSDPWGGMQGGRDEGRGAGQRLRIPTPPAPPQAPLSSVLGVSGAGPTYSRERLMVAKEVLQKAGQLNEGCGIRLLHVPNFDMGGVSREQRGHREDRDRDRERRDRRDGGGREERRERRDRGGTTDSPMRERPPLADSDHRAAPGGSTQDEEKPPEEKKANCPSQ